MDEKLDEFYDWLVFKADMSETTDEASAYWSVVREFDERFGA